MQTSLQRISRVITNNNKSISFIQSRLFGSPAVHYDQNGIFRRNTIDSLTINNRFDNFSSYEKSVRMEVMERVLTDHENVREAVVIGLTYKEMFNSSQCCGDIRYPFAFVTVQNIDTMDDVDHMRIKKQLHKICNNSNTKIFVVDAISNNIKQLVEVCKQNFKNECNTFAY